MGFAKAMGAALLAEKITARQADAWGMIWQAVPDDEFTSTIEACATKLAQGPTVAYRLIKQALRGSFDNTLDDQLEIEATLQGEAGRTRDFQEGVMAFLEKRPARYEGR
jgi:2-(1,2-epoxy-1,2-dihydrophenyl)acetyl-CoA isomerase